MAEERNFPTMIIPQGTEISVNEKGQLAIRTPGNLIIQNPGAYSVIECTGGSMRVDATVKVDAVSVSVADTCCIAGTLTAWQVKAKKIILEKGSQAYILLLQSDSVELDPKARLVGNFGSEKELYLMLGRFSQQLKELPSSLGPGEASPALAETASVPARPAAPDVAAGDGDAVDHAAPASNEQQVADTLALLRMVLPRELLRPQIPDQGRQGLSRLLELARAGDLAAVATSYLRVLAPVEAYSPELRNVRERLDMLFPEQVEAPVV